MCRCTLFMCSQIELLSRKKELEKWQYQKKGKDKITKSEWIRKRKTKKSQKYPTQREIRNQSVTNKNRQQNSHPQNQRNKTQKEIWCERECHLFLLHCVCLRHYYHMPGWSWNLQNGQILLLAALFPLHVFSVSTPHADMEQTTKSRFNTKANLPTVLLSMNRNILSAPLFNSISLSSHKRNSVRATPLYVLHSLKFIVSYPVFFYWANGILIKPLGGLHVLFLLLFQIELLEGSQCMGWKLGNVIIIIHFPRCQQVKKIILINPFPWCVFFLTA